MASLSWRLLSVGLVLVTLAGVVGCQLPGGGPAPASVPTTLEEVPRISPADLKAQLDAGEDIVIVDTRSLDEFQAVHIEGAISIPLTEINDRFEELPRDKEIVLYCT